MTDLAKKAKAQQWSTKPTFASSLVKNPKKVMLMANEDDDTPISVLVTGFDPNTGNSNLPTVTTLYNGTTFDVMREAVQGADVSVTGVLGVQILLTDPSGATLRRWLTADIIDGQNGANFAAITEWIYNGSSFDKYRTAASSVSATGATPLSILAAGGAGVQNRIFKIVIGSSIAGVVVISDGTTTWNVQVPVGGSVVVDFSPNGFVQGGTNAAFTATLATATLTAIVLYGPS